MIKMVRSILVNERSFSGKIFIPRINRKRQANPSPPSRDNGRYKIISAKGLSSKVWFSIPGNRRSTGMNNAARTRNMNSILK